MHAPLDVSPARRGEAGSLMALALNAGLTCGELSLTLSRASAVEPMHPLELSVQLHAHAHILRAGALLSFLIRGLLCRCNPFVGG